MAQLPAEKQRFLDEMRSFIEEEEKWLREIMQYVGWNIEDLPKIVQENTSKFEICPFNNEHRVPQDSMEAHVSKCWKKHGSYPDVSSDVSTFDDDSASTSKTVDLSLLKPSNECSASNSRPSTSLIELLTAERDAKRRRASYRKKGVHTNKKTYNEVLRELIDNEMKTLEFGLNTDDETKNSLTSANEERSAKNSVYAGIGNWIYHGNPYKRWMTIEEEEEREILKNQNSAKIGESDFHSKYSTDQSRHSREDQPRNREYVDRSPRRHERYRSNRYDHHSNYSSRHEQSYSDRHKRDYLEDRLKRHEHTNFSYSEHKHREERHESEFSSRHSSVCGVESTKRERSSQRLHSRDRKRQKYDEDSKRISNKSSKNNVKLESRASSKSRESELAENLVKTVELEQFPSTLDAKNKEVELHDDASRHEDEEKSSNKKGHSSNSSDEKRKHHKKKKKHKKSKKKKKKRSSSESSTN
ncbi:hypothetical protein V9T40_010057 [Parthenolecanium corni]|uniref:CHHC U11-48K-type domain-containing protein n=1 Tax=Parthenolecanium corni TaxID=536013 RepID=A0AAN9Y5T8_9HEMI